MGIVTGGVLLGSICVLIFCICDFKKYSQDIYAISISETWLRLMVISGLLAMILFSSAAFAHVMGWW